LQIIEPFAWLFCCCFVQPSIYTAHTINEPSHSVDCCMHCIVFVHLFCSSPLILVMCITDSFDAPALSPCNPRSIAPCIAIQTDHLPPHLEQICWYQPNGLIIMPPIIPSSSLGFIILAMAWHIWAVTVTTC
jgi:hypothetical protein